jgi:hypothetical protein
MSIGPVVVVLIVLAVALGLVRADQVCARFAERTAAEYLAEPFGHRPSVRVHGTPFLTQVVRGRYRDIEVSGSGRPIDELTGATVTAHLYSARLPPLDLLRRRTTQLPCDRVEGRLLLPYRELARITHIPGLSLTFERDRLVASAALPVPGISALARVSGEAVLTVSDGGGLWLQVRRPSVAGISLPGLVLDQLLRSLTVPIPLPTLPYGLYVTAVEPAAAGLIVHGAATDVVFLAPSTSHDPGPASRP